MIRWSSKPTAKYDSTLIKKSCETGFCSLPIRKKIKQGIDLTTILKTRVQYMQAE